MDEGSITFLSIKISKFSKINDEISRFEASVDRVMVKMTEFGHDPKLWALGRQLAAVQNTSTRFHFFFSFLVFISK